MKQTVPLMKDWRGMAPDKPRDSMADNQLWRMEDLIPGLLGSKLESRQGWAYHFPSPIEASTYITAQIWVNTLGGSHHLAATPGNLYNLDVPGSPRLVVATPGALWPMATLYEYVLIPRTGNQLPVVIRYEGGSEVVVTTHASIPTGKVATTWQSRFVLGNGNIGSVSHPNRVFFLSAEWGGGLTTTPIWDPIAWWDTTADITGFATTRNSLLIFHEGTVERLRGTKPPGQDIDPDLWMEPLIGLGGCNEPHTICYWNDNVVFADARGVYVTDGTTIRDITTQGGIGREWRRAYHPDWRVAAGVVYDQYVIAMTDLTNKVFKKCFVCDLYSRNWSVFNNMPFSSFVATVGERERLFGGGIDARVADVSAMWNEADSALDTVDGNATAVRPVLETAWYRMSEASQMKRVKNVFFDFDLAEDNGAVKVYVCEQVQPRTPADWILVKTIAENDMISAGGTPINIDGYQRRRIAVGRESYGFAFKIEVEGTIKNLKLYDLAAELQPAREATYAGIA